MSEYGANVFGFIAFVVVIAAMLFLGSLATPIAIFLATVVLLRIAVVLADIRDDRRPEPPSPGSKSDWA